MAIYKAEDVAVAIDGVEVAATTISFNTSAPLSEDRRLGAPISSTGFLTNGPQQSTFSMSFYVTGNATGDCPVFSLLNGGDAYNFNAFSGITGFEEIQGKTFRKRHTDELGTGVYEYIGQHSVYAFRYDPTSDIILLWKGDYFMGSWLSGHDMYGTGDWNLYESFLTRELEEFYESGGNLFVVGATQSGTGRINRVGFLDCTTGSTISLGGTGFASGAALTSLNFAIQPFSPILCSATFDIYNPVTGTFPTGGSSLNISPSKIAHGMYSYYSGIAGISDVQSVGWAVSAERRPRYVIGKNTVHDIKTTKASKRISFEGWGESTALLPQSPSSFIVALGSQTGTVFIDYITGRTIDNSFSLPNVGLMSKSFSIVQNML